MRHVNQENTKNTQAATVDFSTMQFIRGGMTILESLALVYQQRNLEFYRVQIMKL
jgi:hypothetical protein